MWAKKPLCSLPPTRSSRSASAADTPKLLLRYLAFLSASLLAHQPLAADTVFLKSGKKIEGQIIEEGETVRVRLPAGEVAFPKRDVLRVERSATKRRLYEEKARGLAANDAAARLELGRWCLAQGLRPEAEREFHKVLAVVPDHPEARTALGYRKLAGQWVKAREGHAYFKGQWLPIGQAMRTGQALYKTRRFREAAALFLEIRQGAGQSDQSQMDAAWWLARSYERLGKYPEAVVIYAELLSARRPGKPSALIAARRSILEKHPDGQYLVKQASKQSLFNLDEPTPSPGKASLQPLTDEKVMESALRDEALAITKKGVTIFREAQKTELTDSGKAQPLYESAGALFEQAEELAPGTARHFQLEVVRKQIAQLHREVQLLMAKAEGAHPNNFGFEVDAARRLTPAGKLRWKVQIRKFSAFLVKAEERQKRILALAQPYRDELAKTIAEAKANNETLQRYRAYLEQQRFRDSL